MISQQEFTALAQQGYNRIPVALETLADLDTPLSVYLKLANRPYTYLLESVVGGERFGRYSIVGLPARTVLRISGARITVAVDGKVTESLESRDPLGFIESFQSRFKAASAPGDLRFVGGLTGYFGYDTVRYIEPKLAHTQNPDTMGVPDILLMLSEELAVVDNLSGKLHLIIYADPADPGAYAKARGRIEELRVKLRTLAPIPAFQPTVNPGEPVTEFPEEKYLAAVARSKQYILDGDIMQVQISQRIRQPFAAPPINLYRALRFINP